MKIIVATGIYPPDIGGPATYSKLLNDELPKRGIEVQVLSFGEVRKLPKLVRHLVYMFRLFHRSLSVDVIFSQDTVSVGLPSLIVSIILQKKFFVRVPGDYAWEQSTQRYGVRESIDEFQNKRYGWKVELIRYVQKRVVNGADQVITPSLYFKDLVSGWVKDRSNVTCIYNGIDLSISHDLVNNFQKKTIISAGRLVPWKGFVELIIMMENLPGWRLDIAGDGPQKTELSNLIREKQLESRVYLLGQVSRDELLKRIKNSEIFVLNTSFESFSFQVVESMAVGTPVITTNIGNLSEIIENGVSGMLVDPGDTGSIKDYCIKLSDDEDFRRKIVGSATQRSKKFSIENTLDQLVRLIGS